MKNTVLLALDVSTTTTGYCVMDQNLKLLNYGQFSIVDRGLTDIQYTTLITKESFQIINRHNINDLIIEDVFFGKNIGNLKTWCRVHGGIGMSWAVKHNEPNFMMASEARRRLGINKNSTKIEIQLEVAKWYNMIKNCTHNKYKKQFEDLLEKRKSKQYTKNQFDYRIKKISKLFEEETGISEHIADSIVLGRAFFQKKQEIRHV